MVNLATSMNDQIEQLEVVLELTLAVFALVVAGVIIYVLWLLYRLHREVRALRPPEVDRGSDGRRIKERV